MPVAQHSTKRLVQRHHVQLLSNKTKRSIAVPMLSKNALRLLMMNSS